LHFDFVASASEAIFVGRQQAEQMVFAEQGMHVVSILPRDAPLHAGNQMVVADVGCGARLHARILPQVERRGFASLAIVDAPFATRGGSLAQRFKG